jgi:hypothetical protein
VKIKVGFMAVVMLFLAGMEVVSASPAEQNSVISTPKIGVGYQGIMDTAIFGNSETLNGISVRGWSQPYGLNLSLYQMSSEVGNADAEAIIIDVRGLYALRTGRQSRLYAGAELALGKVEWNNDDETLIILGPLVGLEFSFQEIPEIVFHWDVGYTITDAGEYEQNGVSASFGLHYYFQ